MYTIQGAKTKTKERQEKKQTKILYSGTKE